MASIQQFSISTNTAVHPLGACSDPAPLIEYQQKYGTPNDFIGRANSYTNPLGAGPGVAYLLIDRFTLSQRMSNTQGPLYLVVQDSPELKGDGTPKAKNPKKFSTKIYIDKAYSMELAKEDEFQGHLLIKAFDIRSQFKYVYANKNYNVRNPAPIAFSGTGLYYAETLNTGPAIWTWEGIFQDLWGLLPASLAGSAPSLPYTPTGTPENQRYNGVQAWEAIHHLLAQISCSTKFNQSTNTFEVVKLHDAGTALPGLSLIDVYGDRLMYSAAPVADLLDATMPAEFEVHFPRLEKYIGQERDVQDDDNWEYTSFYAKTVATTSTKSITGSKLALWDKTSALYDVDAPGWDNSSALDSRAAEIAAQAQGQIEIGQKPMHRIFSGVLYDETPGPKDGEYVTQVTWRNLGGAEGLVTELRNRPEDLVTHAKLSSMGDGVWESMRPHDFNRNQYPLYPRATHVVQIYNSGGTSGEFVEPTQDTTTSVWYHSGKILDGEGTNEDCWMRFGGVSRKTGVERTAYIGRLIGSIDVNGDVRPQYLIYDNTYNYVAYIPTSVGASTGTAPTITPGSGTADIYYRDKGTGALVLHKAGETVYNLCDAITGPVMAFICKEEISGDWYVTLLCCTDGGS